MQRLLSVFAVLCVIAAVWPVYSAQPIIIGTAVDGTGGPRTFLDTLNRGKEIALLASDLPQIVITPALAVSQPSADAQTTQAASVAAQTAQTAAAQPRFRIQIMATSHADAARREKTKAEAAIRLPIMMSSEQPLYKLYAGEFKTRAEAEVALPRVRSAGYGDAWIVSK